MRDEQIIAGLSSCNAKVLAQVLSSAAAARAAAEADAVAKAKGAEPPEHDGANSVSVAAL